MRVIPAPGDRIDGDARPVLLRAEYACLVVYTDGVAGWFVIRARPPAREASPRDD